MGEKALVVMVVIDAIMLMWMVYRDRKLIRHDRQAAYFEHERLVLRANYKSANSMLDLYRNELAATKSELAKLRITKSGEVSTDG